MADPQVPSRTTDHWHLPENPFPASAPHQPHGHVQQHLAIPHMAGDDQQHAHRDGVPQPVANGAMQGQIQYPHQINEPHYNSAQYHPAPLYPEVPYMHIPRDVGPTHEAPVQAQAFPPEVQRNHDVPLGDGAHWQYPAAGPREPFPGVWPQPAPHANMRPQNGLRYLADHYLNNPDMHVNVIWVEPGPGGRFRVWIAIDLVDII